MAWGGEAELAKLSFAELHACGFEFIDKLEQLPLPANELGAGLSAAAIGVGEVFQGIEVFRLRRDILRALLSAIREDGVFVKAAVVAVAGRFAALSAQGIEGARQERRAAESRLEQSRQELLELPELGTEGTEALVHEIDPVADGNCRLHTILTYRKAKSFVAIGRKCKKEEPA